MKQGNSDQERICEYKLPAYGNMQWGTAKDFVTIPSNEVTKWKLDSVIQILVMSFLITEMNH